MSDKSPPIGEQDKVIPKLKYEEGKNKDGIPTPNNTHKNKPQQKQTHRETLHCDQTGFNVESDSDEEYTSNTDPGKRKPGKRKLEERRDSEKYLQQNRTKREATRQQSTLKSDQTRFDAEATGKNDPSLKMKHTHVPTCRQENISEQINPSDGEEEIHQPQKSNKQKNSCVNTDSEDENHKERTNNITRSKNNTRTIKQ